MVEGNTRPGLKDYVFLHAMLFLYGAGGIFSKTAASKPFGSFEFFLFYGLMLFNLAVYAVLWQQVLKRFPLSTAFSNKSVTIVWGMLWGAVIFGESITPMMIVGCLLILVGIYLTVSDHG